VARVPVRIGRVPVVRGLRLEPEVEGEVILGVGEVVEGARSILVAVFASG